jgi:hypothetical protein
MRRGLFALGVLLALASPARADFNLQLGLKWIPVNYTKPITASTTGGGAGSAPLFDDQGWQTTNLVNNFGGFFLDGRLGFQISLDLGWGSVTTDVGSTSPVDTSFTQFGFSLGGKYYITAPRREHVSPYILLDFFKYFSSVSTKDSMITDSQASYVAGLVSPLGVDAAVGAEYFFTPAFSIGAEVLGIKYAYAEGDFTTGNIKTTTKHQYVTFYTGISLNYRFAIAGSVHVKEENGEPEEAPKRPTKRVAPAPRHEDTTPPPPKNEEPPPENPEEVD